MAFDVNTHLMNLKGKAYLPVAARLVWFREVHPDWGITTELLKHDYEKGYALFKAVVHNAEGRTIATAHGSETAKDFPDFSEKAETKAVGRALAMCGFGTAFAPELEEGERVVDSPQEPKRPPAPREDRGHSFGVPPETFSCENCLGEISQAEHEFSLRRFKKPLCRECQKEQTKK
jgi:hypothetical protein